MLEQASQMGHEMDMSGMDFLLNLKCMNQYYTGRIIKAFIAYHLRKNILWDPRVVTQKTPVDICEFITQKCGPKGSGYEGRKVSSSSVEYFLCKLIILKYATAVSTRAALTLWYRSLRPYKSISEWRVDAKTGNW